MMLPEQLRRLRLFKAVENLRLVIEAYVEFHKPKQKMKTMKKISIITAAAALVLASGCTSTKYQSPTGEKFSRVSFGTQLSLGELSVSGDTNGVRTISLKGYQTDQVQALSAVTSAAVEAAIKGGKAAIAP